MKIIYLTAKRYPGGTADHAYILNLSRAFGDECKDDFRLVVCNSDTAVLNDIPHENVHIPSGIKRTLFFAFWFLWFVIVRLHGERRRHGSVCIFSNDLNLLSVALIWKKILRAPLAVCADWHLLTHTWKDRFVASNVDCSITTSHKLAHLVRKLSLQARAVVVHGGVDLEAFESVRISGQKRQLRLELNLPNDLFLVGYVGLFRTLGQEKGLSTMIGALTLLDQKFHMVFVGGSSEEITFYRNEARIKGVELRCTFIERQDVSRIAKYEMAMDALVIPYPDLPHYRSYGFPMKVYEYMASGVPFVYTKLELTEEVAADCAYGIRPDSPEDLAEKLRMIESRPAEAAELAKRALTKVASYSWKEKARAIIFHIGIMLGMLSIPNKALAYILFQRTEFSIYQKYPWLLRLVMNRRFPIYGPAVRLEAAVLSGRTKRLFSADMEREYGIIAPHLANRVTNVLDIGSGVGGIDIMIYKHYEGKGVLPKMHLLDKTEVNDRVYYGLEKVAAYYNSLDIARTLLKANGVPDGNIETQEAGKPIFPGKKFELIMSLISWGFHYPVGTYLDEVFNILSPGGMLILDVRKDSGGEEALTAKFGPGRMIYEARKFRRMLYVKSVH